MVGAASAVTVRVADAAAGPAVGVCVVVTPEAALPLAPTVLLVTVRMTVQPVLGMVIPLKLKAVVPAFTEFVSPQVPLTAPPAALMLASVSVNWPPVRLEELVLDNVQVRVEVPPDGIETGLNASEIVGAAYTVRVAAVGGALMLVELVVTPEAVFD
jgi:hypothetical protein